MTQRVQLRHRLQLALTPSSSALAVLAALGAIGALTGCGSAAAPSAGHPAAPASSAPWAAPACSQSALRVTLDARAAGAAAGSYYVPLEFTNSSSRSCTLPGYPAVTFARGAAGAPIGAPAARQKPAQASGLLLAPDKVAHAWVEIADVSNYPTTQCKPVQAAGLRVSLASDAMPAFLARPSLACENPVSGSNTLAVFPMQPGQASRGAAP
jgi:Protein of unknown function (DUF4232)